MGDLLPIMEEVEVHHLQEDLQASDQGRMRELELSRFNFFMIDHIFAKQFFKVISLCCRLAAKQKRSLEKLPVAMVTNLL